MYKVLIVDDDKTERYMLRQFQKWENYGFVIEDEARDGKEALIKLSAQSYDLIITDIRMPGMDGIALLNEIKMKNLDVCLMLLSTFNDFEYAQQGIRLGVIDFIAKPVDDAALCGSLDRIKKHLDEKKITQSRSIENNLRAYCLENQERKLADLMLAGSPTVIDEAANTCLELVQMQDQDLVKTSLLLEKMLVNLSEKIYKLFPCLAALEKLTFDNALSNAAAFEEIREKFLNSISIMLAVITKYELHHLDSVVKKTCQYVMQHVEEDVKLDNIANEVHISSSYISKLFKQKTGCNFTDYVIKVKMEHAKQLLRSGEYKNYEISEKLGYSSPDYFCHLFKDYTGYTPIEFRKMK